jgi:transposase-like protein
MGKRKTYDWEAIEREYRAGQLSISEIARQHGCSRGAIQKKANQRQWTRDLSEKVRRDIRARLVAEEVAGGTCHPDQAVEEAAKRGIQVVRDHRTIIGKTIGLAKGLLARIENEVLPYKEQAELFRTISQGLHKVVPLERQAFSLDEPEDEGKERVLKVIYEEARTGEEKDQD